MFEWTIFWGNREGLSARFYGDLWFLWLDIRRLINDCEDSVLVEFDDVPETMKKKLLDR